jgi:hypothetical protein
MGHAATIVAEYEALLWRTEDLVREFQPRLSAGTVIRAVTACRAELRRAGVRDGLARAAEERARTLLQQRAAAASGRGAGGQWSGGRARAGHSRSRAPSTATCSENRWSGRATL